LKPSSRIVAGRTVGGIERFPSGRHLACWLGLTAREHSTGGRQRLGRNSRAGDTYVRTLLVNGARSALLAANRFATPGGGPSIDFAAGRWPFNTVVA
jgi:transposase